MASQYSCPSHQPPLTQKSWDLFFLTLKLNKYNMLPCLCWRLRSLPGVWNNCVKSWTPNWLGVTATDLPIIPLLLWDWQGCQKKREREKESKKKCFTRLYKSMNWPFFITVHIIHNSPSVTVPIAVWKCVFQSFTMKREWKNTFTEAIVVCVRCYPSSFDNPVDLPCYCQWMQKANI